VKQETDINVSAILVAGGSSIRMGFDKIFTKLGDKSVIEHSIQAFLRCHLIKNLIIVINENTASKLRDIVNKIKTNTEIRIVSGGTTRMNSVANGLNEINQNCDFVAIHDGARPWINPLQIIKVLEQAEKFGAAASGRPVTDTIKKCDNNAIVTESISREELWAMETPQIFSRDIITKAYSEILKEGIDVTDEVSAVMHYGKPVKIVHNEWANPKVTFPKDLKIRPPSYND
tara:strand:+ start:2036 stop:2728 length:693 start_codon:yes stop_codon:yes gene_type:complete